LAIAQQQSTVARIDACPLDFQKLQLTILSDVLLSKSCMSARKAELSGPLHHPVTVEARQTRLSLSPDAVVFHKNGIEFRSTTAFSAWAEMTMTLTSPRDGSKIHCTGVVIACTGNKHTGYHVSMVFTSLSKQAQERLSTMAFSQPG
jgi:hypothetical protein